MAVSPWARAGDGRLHWYTIESEHFVISYHAPLEKVAHRVALVAERAHENLVPSLRHVPSEKTLIVVDDTTDSSNGFAQVLPRNSIRVLVSAPPSKSDLSDHDDWLYALVVHEYAHILHLDTIGWLPNLVNSIVGKSWAPNQFQPRWVVEGLATYEESRYSSGGRLRQALQSMNMRIATLSNDERGLDEMTHGPRAWPHGNTSYLYGSRFLAYIFDRFGPETISKMSHDFGGNPIPFALNRSIRRATGKRFDELYSDWLRYRRDRYAAERESVERAGIQEGRRLTYSGEVNINPRYTRDGNFIVWQHSPGTVEARYEVMPSGGRFEQRKTYALIRRSGEFDILSDGSLILEQTDTVRAKYISQELFRWDYATKELHRMTTRARMRDPSVSPDERQVAFVMNGAATRKLAIMALVPDGVPRVVWEGENEFEQAFDPAWSPDGKQLAFSAWRRGGYRDILVLDLQSGLVRQLAHDRAQDVDPAWSPDGRYLFYSSDRTGIYNIFAFELETGKLMQVTNVLAGAVGPAISPNGRRMTYQGYASKGYELYEMLLDPRKWRPAPLYINDRPASVEIAEDAYPVSAIRKYRPLETLAPDRVDLQWDAPNRRVNMAISGSDVVGHHRYTLGGSVDVATGYADIGGVYSNNRYWAGVRLAVNRTIGERGGFVIADRSARFLQERMGATLSVSLPVLRVPDGTASISLSYDFDYVRDVRDPLTAFDPNDSLPSTPETDMAMAGIALRFTYADTKGFAFTLGPQVGKSISLSMRVDDPALGSAFRSLNLDYRLETYARLPWGQTPVLSFRISGGVRASGRSRVPRYGLGGVRKQDLVRSLLDNSRVGSTGMLRGYAPRVVSGTQMHLANIEYRQELWNIESGAATLPIYFRKLHVAGLFDVGDAFDGTFEASRLRTSVGASLRLNMLLGYFVPGTLDLGYARGLGEGGLGEWWALLTGSL